MNASGWSVNDSSGTLWMEKTDARLQGPLYLTGDCSSTLDIANVLCRKNLFPLWSSVLSASQNSGRGQMRRKWFSPQGNLYAALRLPLEGPFTGTAAATAIGALIAETLTNMDLPVLLKWPNDLIQEQQKASSDEKEFCKVAGILLEEKNDALIAGIGINLDSCPGREHLRDQHALPAGIPQGRNKKTNPEKFVSIFTLWVNLAAGIFSCYTEQCNQKSWWVSLAEKHLAFSGCQIALADALPEFSFEKHTLAEGTIAGIEPSGALKLQMPQGTETFLGGSMMPPCTMPCLE